MSSGKEAVKAALLANGIIAIMKLIGAIFSGSASMLAEFKHSVADWANGLFLLIGINQSGKNADERFQFGHGKKAFFWAFIASLGMLFIGGALSIEGGIEKILHPEPLKHVSLNIVILLLSVLFECYSLLKAVQAIIVESGGEYTGFSSIIKVPNVLNKANPNTKFIFFEDTAALLGLLIAFSAILISYYSGETIWDGIASVIIGILLLTIGLMTAKENMNNILGEAAEPKLILEVGNFARSLTGVKDINEVKSMIIGPGKYLFYIIIEAHPEIRLKNLDDLELMVRDKLKIQFSELEFVHVNAIADNNIPEWESQAKILQ